MPTQKRFKSVTELVRSTASPEVASDFEKRIARRQLVKRLIAIRSKNGLSQKDIAEHLGCTQSRVSKLEGSMDDDLRLGDLHGYADALGLELNLVFSPRQVTLADKVKYHVFCIRRLLEELAELAKDEELAKSIAGFFGETLYNVALTLQRVAKKLPKNEHRESFIHIEVQSDDDECTTTSLASTANHEGASLV